MAGTRICFVIAPIGPEGSDTRLRSDQVLRHVIGPAAQECGYDTLRADKIAEPGMITAQVIQHVVEDALVIADLTGRNPNVFYELAIRHAVRKPVVQVISSSDTIPFDLAVQRTIVVDHHDLDSVARAREEIVRQVRAVEANPSEVDNPISAAMELHSLRLSENPLEKSNAQILAALAEMGAILTSMRDDGRRWRVDSLMFEELLQLQHRLSSLEEHDSVREPTSEVSRQLRSIITAADRLLFRAARDLDGGQGRAGGPGT